MKYLILESRMKNFDNEYLLKEVAIFEQEHAAISFVITNIKSCQKMKYPQKMVVKDLEDNSITFESECYFNNCRIV